MLFLHTGGPDFNLQPDRGRQEHRESIIWGKERIPSDMQPTDVLSLLSTFPSNLGGIALARGFSTFTAFINAFFCMRFFKRRGLYLSWMLSSISHRLRRCHRQQLPAGCLRNPPQGWELCSSVAGFWVSQKRLLG